jgi:hypothetical protein
VSLLFPFPTRIAVFIGACRLDIAYSALLDGPLVWDKLRRLRQKTSVQVDSTGLTWPTLAEWSRHKELKIAPEELERKIIAMFPEDIVVHVRVQPSKNKETPDEEVQKSAPGSLAL